ncbi:MAG: NAD(P)/FAD-dependent oxidoreductase [Rhodospirillaceae bacterium]|nr:NAD(P)/FAD-dependent oxidoreductase [Rhodospirillaceae bacterium]
MSNKPAAEHSTDIAVIGAGPAGLFSVFECGMLKMSCHVIDALDAIGGQLSALYPEKPIYDIPGYPSVLAANLVTSLEAQAAPFDPVYHLNQQVTALEEQKSGRWRLQTSKGVVIDAGAVIIAAGVGAFGPNRPPLEGIEAYEGQGPGVGVHYLVKRREDFLGKKVVIAGGGDSAVDWALSLADIASSLAIVHRRPKFRAAPDSAAKLQQLATGGVIDMVVPFQLARIDGDGGKLSGVTVADLDGNERHLEADALLPFFGLSQNLGPITDWGLNLDHHQISIDPVTAATGKAGIFAVGDIAAYPNKLKLILSGFAEAAGAAHAARAHLHPGEALHFEYSTTQGVPGEK